jgi:hypothetical protein
MVIAKEEFNHPTQASRVVLSVFQQPAGSSRTSVQGMRDEAGFLVTESWLGASKVVKTLGFFDSRESALAELQGRAQELVRQRFQPAPSAA